jgi:hypothetical protein
MSRSQLINAMDDLAKYFDEENVMLKGGARPQYVKVPISALGSGVVSIPSSYGSGRKKKSKRVISRGGKGTKSGARKNDWIQFIKEYAAAYDIEYAQALRAAKNDALKPKYKAWLRAKYDIPEPSAAGGRRSRYGGSAIYG